MKTAVEWLVSEVAKNGLSMKHQQYLEIIEKALEMEKEQIVNAFAKGSDEESDYHGFQFITPNKAIEYYTETFKQ